MGMNNSKVSYRQQFTRCGKQRCRKCREGAGHGPYWYAYWSENGRTVSKYIGSSLPPQIEQAQQIAKRLTNSPANYGNKITTSTTSNEQPVEALDADPHVMLRIYLLGQFRVERRSGNGWQIVTSRIWQRRRARVLLGCLLSSSGRMLGREQAMEALWPDLDRDTAANRLNGAVHELRQILEPGIVRPAASQMLRLERDMLKLADASQIWVDAEAFEGLLNQANSTDLSEQAEQIFEEALALYGGDYLLEELYSEWAARRRESLRRGWMGLLLKLADLRAARGALISAIEPLDRLLAADPTHETAVRRLMLLLTQLDRRGEALHVYQQLLSVLKRDDAGEPLPETQELYEAIRQGQVQASRSMAIPVPRTEIQSTTKNNEVGVLPETLHISIQQHQNLMIPRIVASIVRQIGRHNQSPLVGREQELETLSKYMLAVERLSEGAASAASSTDTQNEGSTSARSPVHFLLLMGEPGIGKTRLAEELSQEANNRGWSIIWSRTYEQETSIPYHPWIEVLRTVLEEVPTEGLQRGGQVLVSEEEVSSTSTTISALVGQSMLERLSVLLPELATGDRFSLSQHRSSSFLPDQERLHLWEAVLEFLKTFSQVSPLLVVLDDLHWTDDSSLELLAYLIRRLQDKPVLFLGTYRGMELRPTSSLHTLINDLRREQAIVTLPVQPLTEGQIASLVAHLPEHIVQFIQFQAGGNPFFAEELARVSETSSSSSSNDRMQSTPFYTEARSTNDHIIALPETIAAVLERHLSKLSSDCQELLGKAAVLGGSFSLSQLLLMASDFSQSDEDSILDLLDEALTAGLLVEEGSDTGITYHFWHPLIVSHLYELLSAARRAQLHRRAANSLLQL